MKKLIIIILFYVPYISYSGIFNGETIESETGGSIFWSIPDQSTAQVECVDYSSSNDDCSSITEVLEYLTERNTTRDANAISLDRMLSGDLRERYSECGKNACTQNRTRLCNLISDSYLDRRGDNRITFNERSLLQKHLVDFFSRKLRSFRGDKEKKEAWLSKYVNDDECVAINIDNNVRNAICVGSECSTRRLNMFQTMMFTGSFNKLIKIIETSRMRTTDIIRIMFGSEDDTRKFLKFYYNNSTSRGCNDYIEATHENNCPAGTSRNSNPECSVSGCNSESDYIVEKFFEDYMYKTYPNLEEEFGNKKKYKWDR